MGGGYVDVLTGGFPCQPFSVAGQRKGTEDDRYLWPHFKRAITEIKPRWVVGENVAGIASMVQPSEGVVLESQADLFGETTDRVEVVERYVIETICQDLESIGYSVQPIVIPACAVGAPHRRDRVFFLARRTDAGVAPDAVVAGIKGLRKRKIDSYSAGIVANSEGEQSRPQPRQRQISDERKRKFRGGRRENHPRQQIERLCRGERCWEGFPTQSPICGGDDGFPVSLDALSVPFQQWRRDSIKAYGNAIVPQVMLEIFKAIETVEQTHTKQ